jgi:hypothetical protein
VHVRSYRGHKAIVRVQGLGSHTDAHRLGNNKLAEHRNHRSATNVFLGSFKVTDTNQNSERLQSHFQGFRV